VEHLWTSRDASKTELSVPYMDYMHMFEPVTLPLPCRLQEHGELQVCYTSAPIATPTMTTYRLGNMLVQGIPPPHLVVALPQLMGVCIQVLSEPDQLCIHWTMQGSTCVMLVVTQHSYRLASLS
jgi:hypothetical protein